MSSASYMLVMSSASYMLDKLQPLTVGDLKRLIRDFPDDYVVYVPSLSRAPGTFIKTDHILIEFKERAVYLDGDVAEQKELNDGKP